MLKVTLCFWNLWREGEGMQQGFAWLREGIKNEKI